MVYFIAGILIIVLDQGVKAFVRASLETGGSVGVIGDFFRITHVENTGAAFNSLAGRRELLIVVPLILMAGCAVYIFRHRDESPAVYAGITMIIAGGAGNLIDRAVFGTVTDMFDFSIFPPVFNVADICVTLGGALLLLCILAENRLKKSNGK